MPGDAPLRTLEVPAGRNSVALRGVPLFELAVFGEGSTMRMALDGEAAPARMFVGVLVAAPVLGDASSAACHWAAETGFDGCCAPALRMSTADAVVAGFKSPGDAAGCAAGVMLDICGYAIPPGGPYTGRTPVAGTLGAARDSPAGAGVKPCGTACGMGCEVAGVGVKGVGEMVVGAVAGGDVIGGLTNGMVELGPL